jgi:hypothetical protein
MKPRLDSLPMTPEDTAIWCHVFLKAGGWPEWSHGSFQRSDRSDAALMLALTHSWHWLRSRGCTKAEWWNAVRKDVGRIASGLK